MDTNHRLQAYLHASHVRAFRRLLWMRLTVGLIIWVVIALVIALSRAALVVGVVVLLVPAIWALRLEWQAARDFYTQGG